MFKLDHVRPSVVADGIAECQVRFPAVPIVFCETRKLAQEWTYRFLAAARVGLAEELVGDLAVRGLEAAPRSRRGLTLLSFAPVGACRHEGSDWARFDSQAPATAYRRLQALKSTSSQVSRHLALMAAVGRKGSLPRSASLGSSR